MKSGKLAQRLKRRESTSDKLDLYDHASQLQRRLDMLEKEFPQYIQKIQEYDDVFVNQSISTVARLNNIKALHSLTKIVVLKNYDWNTITAYQVKRIVSFVMERWADPEGKETWHTADHKKFLTMFVRWLKTGRRKYDKRYTEPEETRDISIKKVEKKLTREDLLTPEERKEIIDACGANLRDRALLSFHDEAGSRAGETLNMRVGNIEFLNNGGAVIHVNGKTGRRPIHVIKCVPDLAAWMNVHPKKRNKSAPYWLNTGTNQTYEHLTYAAARRVILRTVAKAIKIAKEEGRDSTLSNKRVFLTLMRHGEITRTSKWMPQQISKKRHGWTPNSNMLSTYEHLDQSDVGESVFTHYGLVSGENKEEDLEIPKTCSICKKLNSPNSEICNQCGKPLSLQAALEQEQKDENEKKQQSNKIEELENKLDQNLSKELSTKAALARHEIMIKQRDEQFKELLEKLNKKNQGL